MAKIAYVTCAACGYTQGPCEADTCVKCGEKVLLGTEDISLNTSYLDVFPEVYETGAAISKHTKTPKLEMLTT